MMELQLHRGVAETVQRAMELFVAEPAAMIQQGHQVAVGVLVDIEQRFPGVHVFSSGVDHVRAGY